MNILFMGYNRGQVSPYMALLPELRQQGHGLEFWDYSIQWVQEQSFPEKVMELKVIWTNRLKMLAVEHEMGLSVSEADFALTTFQIVEFNGRVHSELRNLPGPHCCVWTQSPAAWKNGRLLPLVSKGLLDCGSIQHGACGGQVAWELERILCVPRARIGRLDRRPAAFPPAGDDGAPFSVRSLDVAIVSDQEIDRETAAIVESGMDFKGCLMTASAQARKVLEAMAARMPVPAGPAFKDFAGLFLREYKKQPFSVRAGALLRKNEAEFFQLVDFFGREPEWYARLLAAEDRLIAWMLPWLARRLGAEFMIGVYAPESWRRIPGIAWMGSASGETVAGVFRGARLGLAFARPASGMVPGGLAVEIAGAPAVCLTAPDPEIFAVLNPASDLAAFETPEQLSEKIRQFLADESLWARILRNGREKISGAYAWQTKVQQWIGELSDDRHQRSSRVGGDTDPQSVGPAAPHPFPPEADPGTPA